MAAWGQQSWGYGLWGLQGDNIVQVTTANDSPYAWGNKTWGYNNWGGAANIIPIALGNESITAQVNTGWGRLTWGANVWGTEALIVYATGTQLTLSQNSISNITGSATVPVSSTANVGWGIVSWNSGTWGQSTVSTTLIISEGSIDPAPDAEVTGQQINILPLNSVTTLANANISVTGTQLKGSLNSATISINIEQPVTGTQLKLSEGVVDPAPDAEVTGTQLKLSLNSLSNIIGNGTVSLTGTQLKLSRGSITVDLNTPVNVTGKQLTISTGTAVAGASAEAPVTGNLLTVTLNNNSVNVQIWTVINTGTDATWNEVDTAA